MNERRPRRSTRSSSRAFELNFQCARVDDVLPVFDELVARGAGAVAQPVETSWGHFTVFFADPEGNIHSLFAVLPSR